MGKERLFYTGSVNIIRDPRPSGLDHRVYACVSLHDGMSLVKGKGRGCYATFATLTAEIGCDPGDLSRSLKRLVTWGYLTEERQSDRRRKSYRVRFDSRESWANAQRTETEIVGSAEAGNGGNPPQTAQHYSSLKELDSSEEEKLNSFEKADIEMSASSLGIDKSASKAGKRNSAEAGLGSDWALAAHLPRNLGSLPAGAQVSRIEAAYDSIGRDPHKLGSREKESLCEWLTEIAEAFWEEPHGQQAQRLNEEIMAW